MIELDDALIEPVFVQVAVACCCSDAVPSSTPLMLCLATRPISSYLDVITPRVPGQCAYVHVCMWMLQ